MSNTQIEGIYYPVERCRIILVWSTVTKPSEYNSSMSLFNPHSPVGHPLLPHTVRSKILHYHSLYLDHPDPIVFLSLVVNTSVRLYDDFIRLIFLYTPRETSTLTNELQEESDQLDPIIPAHSPRPFISVFHTTSSFHPFSPLHTSS